MNKLRHKQQQKSKVILQQITVVKLLQLSGDDLQQHLQDSVAENPALEVVEEEGALEDPMAWEGSSQGWYTYKSSPIYPNKEWDDLLQGSLLVDHPSWRDDLQRQFYRLESDDKTVRIATYLLGSLDENGYLKSSPGAIVDELALHDDMVVTSGEIQKVLQQVQCLDPAGIAARDLQECLQLQLARKPMTPTVQLAQKILTQGFKLFAQKHYQQLISKLDIKDPHALREALTLIQQLHPYPVVTTCQDVTSFQRTKPDFIVHRRGGDLIVELNDYYLPNIRLDQHYAALAKAKETQAEVAVFIKEKVQRAKLFLHAIKQGRSTLLRVMRAIVHIQRPFFSEGDPDLLNPLIQRQIADSLGMDISTISRAVRNKTVQTDWGTYPLKYFFSEPILTNSGQMVSSRIVKQAIVTLIAEEDKQAPYTDQKLAQALGKSGYPIARRTVAKYREQLQLPIARLRRTF